MSFPYNGTDAVAIGTLAGSTSQGTNSIAIGKSAGQTSQAANSIALNATGVALNPANTGFFVDPIRQVDPPNIIGINTTTKEITYLVSGTSGQVLTSQGAALAPTWTTPAVGGGNLYANFNVNQLGDNKKQRFILPTSKSITSASITAKIDGTITTPQSYTFGSYVQTRIVAGGVGATALSYSPGGTSTSWTTATSPPFSVKCNAIFWTGTRWLAAGEGSVNTLAYSNDGITWVGLGTSIFTNAGGGAGFCFGANDTGRILAGGGGSGSSTNTLAYSDDGGLTWTGLGNTPFTVGGSCFAICWNGEYWVIGGNNTAGSSIYYGTTGTSWTAATNTFGVGGSFKVVSIAWNGSYWLASGTGSGSISLNKSTTVTNWTTVTVSGSSFGRCIAWNGTIWVLGSLNSSSGGYYSYDGTTWTTIVVVPSIASTLGITCLTWDGTKWYGILNEGNLVISYNSINWFSGGITFTAVGGTSGAGIANNNLKRPNTMLIAAGNTTATTTVVGTTLTTSDLEFVDNGFYNQGGYANFSVRID